jgi:cytochrome c oxidase subunit 3
MIPYTVERRADTGVNNVTLGIWLFIASEVMLFGALFSAYALVRTSAPEWPSGFDLLHIDYGLANTLVLVIMTIVFWQARKAPIAKAKRQLLVASLLAAAFLGVKAIEYSLEIGRGLVPSVSMFLVAGLLGNLWAYAGASAAGEPITRGRLNALALYWAFVDVVWIIILVLMYVA